MKTYNFSVTVNSFETEKSLMDEFINEAKDNKRQGDLTISINTETAKVHRQILIDFIDVVNKELSKIGLSFVDISGRPITNGYSESYSFCYINGFLHFLYVKGIEDREFKESIYSTYTGGYTIRVGRVNHTNYTDINLVNINTCIDNVDDVLKYMKHDIMNYLEENIQKIV
jgi:hypothetical protein